MYAHVKWQTMDDITYSANWLLNFLSNWWKIFIQFSCLAFLKFSSDNFPCKTSAILRIRYTRKQKRFVNSCFPDSNPPIQLVDSNRIWIHFSRIDLWFNSTSNLKFVVWIQIRKNSIAVPALEKQVFAWGYSDAISFWKIKKKLIPTMKK